MPHRTGGPNRDTQWYPGATPPGAVKTFGFATTLAAVKVGGSLAPAARGSTHLARLKRAATLSMLRAGRPPWGVKDALGRR